MFIWNVILSLFGMQLLTIFGVRLKVAPRIKTEECTAKAVESTA